MSEFNGFNDDPHAGPPSQIQTSDFEDYDGDEIHQGFYGSNPYLKFPDGKLVHDRAANNHLIETIQKVVFESEEGLFIVSDKKGKTIDLNVFISKNATYLWQSYRKTRPKKWEIVIFLEDNDRDLFSSRAFAVKMGAKARAVLLDNAKSRRKNVYGGIQSDANAEKTVPDFDKREIQELLLTGQIASEESNFYMPVLQAIGYLNGLFAKLYLKLGRGIMSACATVKDNIKLQEKHWNPEAKENQGQDFVPFLLPIQHFGLDLLEVGVKAFTKAILDYQDSITGYLDEFLAFDLPILPPGLKLFQLVLQKFRDRIKAALDGIGKAMVNGAAWLMQFFIDLGHGAVNMINAFLCGLYNSIVDTVVGFFEIIGLLCQGVGGAAKAISRPQRTLAAALELMDEMMQLLLDFNPFEFVESIFNGLQRGVQKASEFFGSLNIEKVSYFLGGMRWHVVGKPNWSSVFFWRIKSGPLCLKKLRCIREVHRCYG